MLTAHGVAKAGWRIVFCPDAYVYHYPRSSLRGFVRQVFGYGATRVRLMRAGTPFEVTTMVPALWVGSLVVLGVGAFLHRWLAWALGAELAAYAVVDLAAALAVVLRTRKWVYLLLLLSVPLMHVAYGVGSLWEVVRPGRDLSVKGGRGRRFAP